MQRNILTVPVQQVEATASSARQDLVAVEEPLEIRVNGKAISITMRTPGHDFDLAAGFLLSEGIVAGAWQIRSIEHAGSGGVGRAVGNAVDVELARGVEVDFERLRRNFYTTSSCGICGKTSIEALQCGRGPALARDAPVFEAGLIHLLPERLRQAQSNFEQTGGLHAAGLFDALGNLRSAREDVGRHNAVDKVIGAEMLADRIPDSNALLMVSGRVSFELVQKTLAAGIPILAAVGAPSSLAVEAARRFGATLIGFIRNDRFQIYAGQQRIRVR